MSYYRYSKLRKLRSIRLLLVQPSQCLGDSLLCHCIETELDSSVAYTALSYTWGVDSSGEASLNRSIFVDGAVMPVTQNLFEALQYLRTSVTLCLWVDAVCINQGDDLEKTTQVAMMSEMYTRAQQVVAWLGLGPSAQDDEAANVVMRCLHKEVTDESLASTSEAMTDEEMSMNKIDRSANKEKFRFKHSWAGLQERLGCPWCDICTAWTAKHRKWPDLLFRWEYIDRVIRLDQESDTPRDGRSVWYDEQYDWFFSIRQSLLDALKGLLARRYWNRRWIVQEINTPRADAVVFRWGKYSISHKPFRAILDIIKGESLASEGANERVRRMLSARDIKDLGKLVATLGHAECSDARDRIYALLGLLDNMPFSPDYSMSAAELYLHYASLLVEQGQVKCVLDSCYNSRITAPSDNLSSQLPSWVPDLRYRYPGGSPTLNPQDKANGCRFTVHAWSLACQWYLLGTCRPRDIVVGPEAIPPRITDIPYKFDCVNDALMNVAMDVHGPEPLLWKDRHPPEETNIALYWIADDYVDTVLDVVLERDTVFPCEGDLLCTMRPPRTCSISTGWEDYHHVAYPYVLRPSMSEPGAYTIHGSCTVLYKDGAAHPSKLHTTRLV